MNAFLRRAFLVILLIASTLHAQDNPPAPGSPSLKFEKISVKDPGINNTEAVSFLIPAGWKTEGGVQWFHDYSILANLLMRVSDPQTGAAIEFLPMQNFTLIDNPVMPMQRGQNYMGNIVWEPVKQVADFVQTFYMPTTLKHLQGARPVSSVDLPKVAEQVNKNYGGQSQVVSSKVRYEFTAPNGQAWEEDVYVTLVFTKWQLGTMWTVNSAFSFRAPRGKLDALTPTMNASVQSMRLNQDWFSGYMYVRQLFNNRMMQGIKDARALSDTIAKNADETRKMFNDAYRERNESQDRINQSFGEYIRGVDTYKNPYEDKPVQLPAGYNDAWVNAKGEYLLSNQGGYNPNVGDTQEWKRMNRRGE